MSTICPFCDSENVVKIDITERFSIPYSDDAVITHKTFRCNSCEEEGNFDHTLDRELNIAIKEANNASASKIIDELSNRGITMTYLEKALRLPFRTTARWKKGKISHSALALLRIIRSFPSLLHVADNNFSHEVVACYQLSHPFEFLAKNTSNPSISLTFDRDHIGINYTGSISSSSTPSIKQEMNWISEKC